VRGLKLTSQADWNAYLKSGKKPANIPSSPDRVYADEWTGFGDWLGTGTVATQLRKYQPYKSARSFVQALRLKGQGEWYDCKSGKKPSGIPANPQNVYAHDGWVTWSDWLGTGRKARGAPWQRFEPARAFVRGLKLTSQADWNAYLKSGKKPANIPSSPDRVYADEWTGFGDWLGTGTVATQLRKYQPYKSARSFVQALRLKGQGEW